MWQMQVRMKKSMELWLKYLLYTLPNIWSCDHLTSASLGPWKGPSTEESVKLKFPQLVGKSLSTQLSLLPRSPAPTYQIWEDPWGSMCQALCLREGWTHWPGKQQKEAIQMPSDFKSWDKVWWGQGLGFWWKLGLQTQTSGLEVIE